MKLEKSNHTPKYSIGQILNYKFPDLYNETRGKVTSIDRIFKATFPDGSFDECGLSWIERDVSSIISKYEINGDELIIYPHYAPDKKETYKFIHYAYTVTNNKVTSLYSEDNLY